MGNGYLGFEFAKGVYHKFTTNKPWDEAKQFPHTKDVNKDGCIVCHPIDHGPNMPRVAEIDTGKSTLNVLRDAYVDQVRRQKMEAWCPWAWYFDERDTWLSPKEADTLSQMWKDIWRDALPKALEVYPMDEIYLKGFIKRVQEILDYAAVHGHWVHIHHFNGY